VGCGVGCGGGCGEGCGVGCGEGCGVGCGAKGAGGRIKEDAVGGLSVKEDLMGACIYSIFFN